ncbi:cleavage and polyadenylation specificity factor subunit 1-like, partial [Notechis scutatus]|uniref:Cleavage and polyadenylation specificity factor subunit 1-like n=1 Tax=Notechis scutatus TaxID=8663 RepID=A0A6J1W508_9SAUR
EEGRTLEPFLGICRNSPTAAKRQVADPGFPGRCCRESLDRCGLPSAATLDGGMGLLLPMQEKTYRRLLMLQNALTSMLPHHAGLNPRAFRMLHVDRRILQNAVRNILDGELLNRYLYLSTMERSELAKKIGTTPDI